MTVRPADVEDVPGLVALMAEFYAESRQPLDRAVAHATFAELLTKPELGRVWLLTGAHGPAGYVVATFVFSMEFGGCAAFLDDLFVRPADRRCGLGSAAIATVIEESRRRGAKAVHVECSTDDTAAVRLYRRAGFADQRQGRRTLTVRL